MCEYQPITYRARFSPSQHKLTDNLRAHTQATQWPLEVKDTFFLLEIFTRFRGRAAKNGVRPSDQFNSLYQRVSGQ